MPELPINLLTSGVFYKIAAMLLSLAVSQDWAAEKDLPVVRAVLFASPTCEHCAKVKEEVLPPLIERYGSRLKIAILSTATQSGYELFLSACMQHGLLRLSVPMLVVGNTVLIGSDEIPQKFPDLIDKNIAAGGVDWPGIPGLRTMLAANHAFSGDAPPHTEPPQAETASAAPSHTAMDATPSTKPSSAKTAASAEDAPPEQQAIATTPASRPSPALNSRAPERAAAVLPEKKTTSFSAAPRNNEAANAGAGAHVPKVKAEPSGIIDLTAGEAEAGVLDRIKRDIYGNGLAILVLAGMLVTLLVSPVILRKSGIAANAAKTPRHDWLVPILTLAGLGVAAYLSHVEVRQVEAGCGPVGDCNTVNQSEYAKLFGVLPIGVLGLLGFLAILIAWTLRRCRSGRISLWAAVGILNMTGFGVLFSVYLTFLEPFVIGATCLWCLSSAVIMTTLYALALKPGRQAWSALAQFYHLSIRPPFFKSVE
jgi:uncharacterized membrane protein